MRKIGVRPAEGIMNPRFYTSDRWRYIRRLVLQRDRWRCIKCGINVSLPRQARVDHIKPVKTHPLLAYDLLNLRTLCASCDNQSHREKGQAKGSPRNERIVIRGFDRNGEPLNPEHHWKDARGGAKKR